MNGVMNWQLMLFKEQGLDIQPQIHLGTKASALERAGIHTIRGDINRSILSQNAIILQAKIAVQEAKKNLSEAKAIITKGSSKIASTIKNEIIDLIREVAKRNRDRLSLPIVGTKYLRLVSNRANFQNRELMERFVSDMKLTTFDELNSFKNEQKTKFTDLSAERNTLLERYEYLQSLLSVYAKYEPYIKFNKERWSLKGFKRKMYERKHIPELAYYDEY